MGARIIDAALSFASEARSLDATLPTKAGSKVAPSAVALYTSISPKLGGNSMTSYGNRLCGRRAEKMIATDSIGAIGHLDNNKNTNTLRMIGNLP